MKPIKELLNFSIIIIDKPTGPTSFTVTEYVKKQLGFKKTSHFGTLDPQVTGVLPIALGRACKLTGFFLGHDKEYVGVLHAHKEITPQILQEVINKHFTGIIKQTPPRKSRVKRQEREREIKSFQILEQDGKNFLFNSEVQGGTYIRKLCSDLGEIIGQGAHMQELRRKRAGIFSENKSYNLYDFTKAVEEYKKGNPENLVKMIIPAEQAIKQIFQVVQIKSGSLKQLLTGKPIFEKDIQTIPNEEVFAIFHKDKFIEIAKKTNEKDIIARPLFVFN